MKKSPLTIIASLAVVILFACATGCTGNSEYRRAAGLVWNTTYNITYASGHSLDDSITLVLNRVGKSLSMFDSTSTLARINRGEDIPADTLVKAVYLLSRRMHRLTEGAFDPTVGALVNAWGFGPGQKQADVDVAEILKYTGLCKTELLPDGRIKRDDARLQLDFAAIAKGFGVDEVARMLQRNGVRDYLVEIGGEIACRGRSPRNNRWKIAIDKPVLQQDTIIHTRQTTMEIENICVATSGNYRNFYRNNRGEIVAHTVNPATGSSAQTDVLSATILAPTCAEADAMATACMVMGSKRAIPVIRKAGYGAYFVLTNGKIIRINFPE